MFPIFLIILQIVQKPRSNGEFRPYRDIQQISAILPTYQLLGGGAVRG